MKTAREYISELRLNKANVDHCVQYSTVNGTLLIDLENTLHAYAEEVAQQALKDAADRAEVEGTHNEGTIGYCVDRDSILLTPIVTP